MKQAWIFIALGLIATQSVYAQQMRVLTRVGDRQSEFKIEPLKKGYQLHLHSNELGETNVQIGKKNFDWIHEQLVDMQKLKKNNFPCERDQTQVSIVHQGKVVMEYDVCLLSSDERAKAMRRFLNTLSGVL